MNRRSTLITASITISLFFTAFMSLSGCGSSNLVDQPSKSGRIEDALFAEMVDTEPTTNGDDSLTDDTDVTRKELPPKPKGLRRGVQAVFLSHWSKSSCDRLTAICGHSKAPGTIEITFTPYIKDPAVHSGDAKDDVKNYVLPGVKYDNKKPSDGRFAQFEKPRYVVDALLRKNKKVYATFFLGFHAGGKKGDTDRTFTASQIKARMQDFHDKFLARYYNNPNVTITICPSLEDEFSTDEEFRSYLNPMLEGLAEAKVRVNGQDQNFLTVVPDSQNLPNAYVISNLRLRRSNNQPVTLVPPYSTAVSYNGTPSVLEIPAPEREIHGISNAAKEEVYSNDGNFIWWQKTSEKKPSESPCSAENPDEQSKLWLKDFSKQTQNENVVLLWRPAYNLFKKGPCANVKPECSSAVNCYEKTKVADRDDPASKPKFDTTEQNVLKYFMGISNTID